MYCPILFPFFSFNINLNIRMLQLHLNELGYWQSCSADLMFILWFLKRTTISVTLRSFVIFDSTLSHRKQWQYLEAKTLRSDVLLIMSSPSVWAACCSLCSQCICLTNSPAMEDANFNIFDTQHAATQLLTSIHAVIWGYTNDLQKDRHVTDWGNFYQQLKVTVTHISSILLTAQRLLLMFSTLELIFNSLPSLMCLTHITHFAENLQT